MKKISARNKLKGKVTRVVSGEVSALVEIDVNGNTVAGVITRNSVDELGISVGDEVTAMIKATSVMFIK